MTTKGGDMQHLQACPKVAAATNSEHLKPLNLGRIMIFDKNRKIYGIALECNVEKGVLSKLSEISDKIGAITRFIQVSMAGASEPSVKAIALLDLSDSNTAPEEALELVRKNEFIKEARLIKPMANRFIFDDYFFPLVFGDERAVIFRKEVYKALFTGLREKFGSAGEAMLYYQGFNVGYALYGNHMSIACKETECLIELAKAFCRTLGWAIIDHEKIDMKKGRAKIQVYQNFECEVGKGSEKPYSQFFRGVIAGWFQRFFGKPVEIKETKCIAKGDAYCEFLIRTT